jgi:hypothetical protein
VANNYQGFECQHVLFIIHLRAGIQSCLLMCGLPFQAMAKSGLEQVRQLCGHLLKLCLVGPQRHHFTKPHNIAQQFTAKSSLRVLQTA